MIHWDKRIITINGSTLDVQSEKAILKFAQDYRYTDIGKKIEEWIGKKKEERGNFEINTDLSQLDYESILTFIDDYATDVLKKPMNQWREYTGYDFAAYYIGDDL